MCKTSEVLELMLKEHTGIHLCDSGFDSGRNWQINAKRDFKSEPKATIDWRDLTVSYNLYHWLLDRVIYDEGLTQLFYTEFKEQVDKDDGKCWLELMNEFPEWLGKYEYNEGDEYNEGEGFGRVTGLYGQGKPIIDNSYNHESVLDQVIQFVYFELDKEGYIALQIHGGADVRGGYTKPKIFNIEAGEFFSFADGTIYCTGEGHHITAERVREFQSKQGVLPGVSVSEIDFEGYREHNWSTDDSCHWYDNGCCGTDYVNLEDYDRKDLLEEDVWDKGKLCVKGDIGYCPTCGAKLAVG